MFQASGNVLEDSDREIAHRVPSSAAIEPGSDG